MCRFESRLRGNRCIGLVAFANFFEFLIKTVNSLPIFYSGMRFAFLERPAGTVSVIAATATHHRSNCLDILTRKPGERIHVGEGIAVSVVKTNRQRVRLAIEAPRSRSICRLESLFTNLMEYKHEPANES